jgi:class 3 adenylate cyclase
VTLLDAIFSRFDQLAIENGCEKIKTIGDSFMAVSGIATPSENHAEKVVRLGLAMQRAIHGFDLQGQSLALRIGIHSGPVVAGVIGKSSFAYDVWGETVNVARRMESTAQSGGIQISAKTHAIVDGKFKMVSRGQVHAKGIGAAESWLVQGEATAQTNPAKDLKAS